MADLLSHVGALAALLAGVAALLWRARQRGAAAARKHRAELDRTAADATRKRMNDADSDLGDDPDGLRDWLRQRGGE